MSLCVGRELYFPYKPECDNWGVPALKPHCGLVLSTLEELRIEADQNDTHIMSLLENRSWNMAGKNCQHFRSLVLNWLEDVICHQSERHPMRKRLVVSYSDDHFPGKAHRVDEKRWPEGDAVKERLQNDQHSTYLQERLPSFDQVSLRVKLFWVTRMQGTGDQHADHGLSYPDAI